MDKSLFAFDIDGTLLNSKKQLLDSTTKSLKKLQDDGHVVMVATGRSRFLIDDLINELDITNYIVCNGSAAYINHRQIYNNMLDRDELKRLMDYFNEKKIDMALTSMEGVKRYSSNNVKMMKDAMLGIGGTLPDYDPYYAKNNDIYQGLAFYSEEVKDNFEMMFPKFRFVRWHEYGVDVIPKEGSKAATILHVAEKLQIPRKNIIAFGDGNNDIEMLQEAGIGIAMGNSIQNVRQAADMITESNDNHGIYIALEKLGFL